MRRDDRADLVQLAVGEHVAVDEAGAGEAGPVAGRAGDAVVEQPPSGREQAVQAVEVDAAGCASPTCSNMPIELIASYGPSCTSR